MTIIHFDVQPIDFVLMYWTNEYGDARMYYRYDGDSRAILVMRNGLDIAHCYGHNVDCSIGWDEGTPGFVAPCNEGKRHTKITVYRLVGDGRHCDPLSRVIADAPRDEKGG